MAGRKLEYQIVTDPSKGIAGLKQFSSAVKKAMADVEGSTDDATTSAQKLGQVFSAMAADITAEAKQAAVAADALGRELGPEIAGRANLDSIVADLNKLGLSFDEITADAKALAAGLRDLEQAGSLDLTVSGAQRARQGFDDIVDGADQANSATANMVGNVSQDLGELGGIAGSTGVAVGQLAEYFTDTAFRAKQAGQGIGTALRSFAGAALPIAGIAVGMKAISHNAEEAEERTKRVTDATEELTRAVEQQFLEVASQLFSEQVLRAITDSKDLNDQFEEMARLNLVGTKRMLDHADAIGLSAESQEMLRKAIALVEAEERQATATEERYGDATRDTGDAVAATADLLPGVGLAWGRYGDAVDDAAAAERQFAQDARDAATELVDAQTALDDMAGAFKEMERSEGAMETAFDFTNASVDAVDRVNEINNAISDLQQVAAEELDLSVNLDPNKIGIRSPFRDAIARARDEIQADLSRVIAVDGADAARTTALSYIARITELLGGAFTAQEVAEMLGLDQFETTIKVQLEQESLAEARAMLQLLAGLPGADPLYVAQIRLALDGGELSPQAASVLLAERLGDLGLDVPTELLPADPADLAKAKQEADAFVARNPLIFGSDVETPDPTEAHRQAQIIAEALKLAFPSLVDNPSNTNNVLRNTQNTLNRNPLVIPVRIGSERGVRLPNGQIIFDQGGTVGAVGGIAAEKGPEILDGKWLAVGPTWVPPGTRVTSRRRTERILRTRGTRGLRRYDRGGVVPGATNITIRAAVVGNQFETMRAVNRAIRQRERLQGTRR